MLLADGSSLHGMQLQDILVEQNDIGFLLCNLKRLKWAIKTFTFLFVPYSK